MVIIEKGLQSLNEILKIGITISLFTLHLKSSTESLIKGLISFIICLGSCGVFSGKASDYRSEGPEFALSSFDLMIYSGKIKPVSIQAAQLGIYF